MSGGREADVAGATRQVPDARATHYWDGPGVTLRAYQRVLDLPEPAWDIYMIYDRDVKWDGELPPEPDFWMHQLGSRERPRVTGPYLNAKLLATQTAKRLHE